MEIDEKPSASLLSLLSQFKPKNPSNTSSELIRLSHNSYKNTSDRFVFRKKNFAAHFTHIYFTRLVMLRPMLESKLKRLHYHYSRIIDVKNNSEAVMIGTIYKEMKMKPNILQRLNMEAAMGKEKFQNYTSSDDFLYLEDETGRIMLDFSEYAKDEPISGVETSIVDKKSYSAAELLTGIIVAVVGRVDHLGHMFVKKIFFTDIAENKNKQILRNVSEIIRAKGLNNNAGLENLHEIDYYMSSKSKDDKFVAIISGLNIKSGKSTSAVRSFVQFLTGQSALLELRELSRKVIRLVIAGDSIQEERDLLVAIQGAFKIQDLYAKMYGEMGKSMRQLDEILEELAKSLNVDIMPGEQDPSDEALPQQPMNRAYFPKSYEYGQFTAVTNPYEFEIDNCCLLGTAGKNVKDLMQFANVSDKEIDIMEHSLYWSHIAPTAPDTLKALPFSDDDPFVLRELPNVYFAGNQSKFDTKLYYDGVEGRVCRLITVPVFDKSQSLVIVNLKNLDTFEITF